MTNKVEERPRAPGIFYGWVVVGLAFAIMFAGFGIAYSFAAFFLELQREFQATRSDISLIFSLSGFLYFALGAVSGPLADRIGARWIISFGLLLIAIGLTIASRAATLNQIYLAYGLSIGVGVGLSYVPSIGVVQRWFQRRRGFASGIAVSGIGMGTFVMPWIAEPLVAWGGWRFTYLCLAALALVVGLVALIAFSADPADRGLAPDNDPQAASASGGGRLSGLRLGEALRTRPFWLMFVSALLTSFGIFIPFVHLTPYAVDAGYTETMGVGLVSLIGMGSILGRFFFGGTADRVGRRRAYGAMFFGMSVMMFWWLAWSSYWALAVFAVAFGAFYGGFVALAPALTADYFGSRSISGIIGVLYSGVAVGTLLGPVLAGYAYDVAQSYTLPIAASAVAGLVSVFCIVILKDPTEWRMKAK